MSSFSHPGGYSHPNRTDAGEQPGGADGRAYTAEQLRVVDRLQRLAYLLDARFGVPGTGIRVGLDGLLGLIPGIGDTAALALSAYIIIEAQKLDISPAVTARMIANVAVDYFVGLIPVLGDVFDVTFRANIRNLRLIGIEVGPRPR